MIRNREMVEAFERSLARSRRPDYLQNLRILEGLYEHARILGAFPPRDPLDGIEVDVRYARAIRVPASP